MSLSNGVSEMNQLFMKYGADAKVDLGLHLIATQTTENQYRPTIFPHKTFWQICISHYIVPLPSKRLVSIKTTSWNHFYTLSLVTVVSLEGQHMKTT